MTAAELARLEREAERLIARLDDMDVHWRQMRPTVISGLDALLVAMRNATPALLARLERLEAVAAAADRAFRSYDTSSQVRLSPEEIQSRQLDVVYALAALRALR